MKNKTNISILDNVGVRRNASIEVGSSGNNESGLILDANAVEGLINDKIGNLNDIDKDVINQLSNLSTLLDSKQDIIDDLETIRSGAAAGSTAIQQHQDISGKANSSDLARVATSGSYDDLTNKPTIPDAQIQSDWNQTNSSSKDYVKNKPTKLSDFDNDSGFTTNEGTITGIKMNGSVISTSGVADLGTVITSHQSLTNYVTKTEFENSINDVTDWYGIMWEGNGANLKRIGNMSMHRTLPIQSKMKRCMLNDDGSVYGYISDSDYTKYEDGTTVDYTDASHQYQVEIPEYRYDAISYRDGNTTKHLLKLYVGSNAGKLSKKLYIGAVEATTDDADETASTKKLYSTCNTDSKFNNGFPKTNLTRAAFRTRAKNRGTGWSQQYWSAYMAVVRLYVVEYCNFNSQDTWYDTTDVNGYKRGGLGIGVSNINNTAWNNYNSYNPFIPCGVTNSLGNQTGVISYTHDQLGTVSVPSYRGIENPFGYIWKWTDGININTVDGTTTVYTCDDISKFTDSVSADYTDRVSFAIPSSGWIASWNWDENGDFIPTSTGGSSNSTLYDYSYWADGLRVLRSGGDARYGANCGWFCFAASVGSGGANAFVGGRLYYTPNANPYNN